MDLRNPGIVLRKPRIHGLFAQSRDCPSIFNAINSYLIMLNYNKGTKVVSTTPEPGRAIERTQIRSDNLSVWPVWVSNLFGLFKMVTCVVGIIKSGSINTQLNTFQKQKFCDSCKRPSGIA